MIILLTAALFLLPSGRTAEACWNTVLTECFDQLPTISWPFQSPPYSGRQWNRYPPYPPYVTWGFQDDYYSTAMCSNSIQALWCIGIPSNDPEFDTYPSNYDAYITYGPVDLRRAVAARVSFYLFNRTEAGFDSIYWGASTAASLTTQSMKMSGKHSGYMVSSFQPMSMNLADLDSSNGDSISVLGRNPIFLFWRFRSNNNSVVNLGAFIDNVTVSWDDGGIDISAWNITPLRLDTTSLLLPQYGDTMFARLEWGTCQGGGTDYPPFHIIGRLDTNLLFDTLISEPSQGMSTYLFSPSWICSTFGEHVLRITIDTLNEVTETNENNNSVQYVFTINPPNYPPSFTWVTPSVDTVFADSTAILRWICIDTLEQANLFFYTDSDTQGCSGIAIPPGTARPENDGPDSLIWNTRNSAEGRVYHPFVRIIDAVNTVCVYAPYPVVIRHHNSAVERRESPVPARLFLDQNYPNPFNPTTELRFGLAQSGIVNLRVFDLLGRQVAEPVNGHRSPGVYRVSFDGTGLPAGLYFYTLSTPEGEVSRKMMLLK